MLFAVFIDFKKAFDSVNRDLPWAKLEHTFKINGTFLDLLKGMYSSVCTVLQTKRVHFRNF